MSQKTSLPTLSAQQSADLLRSGMKLVAEHMTSAMTAMIGPVIEHLAARQETDTGAPAAWRFISGRREQFGRAFSASLKKEQEEMLTRLLKKDKAASGAAKISADSLTLMEDDAVSIADVVSRVSRRMQGPLELALKEIGLVTARLANRETVRANEDPVGPEPVAKALLDSARELGLETSGWAPLLGAFEKPVVQELGRCYSKLVDHYRKHRMDVAEIRREAASRQALGRSTLNPATKSAAAQRLGWMDEVPRVTSMVPAAGASGGAGDSGAATIAGMPTRGGAAGAVAGAAPTMADVRASLDAMVARMNAGLSGMPVALPSPSKPPTDLLDAINEMQQLGARASAPTGVAGGAGATAAGLAPGAAGAVAPAMGALAPAVGVSGADQGAWREVLIAKSTRTVDKLTIELVGMLFDHVLQDNQVPAEIKAVLSRLQFPVLKVALTDAEFFASSAHPGRRLIDRLASTAVGWEPYGDANQRYKTEVERVVQQVLERFDNDVGVFDQLLGEFDAFIGEMPTREADPVARAKRALEEAEKREVLVINTTIQVRRAFEQVELEPYLREFLVGPWVQAMVTATLRDEQTPGFSKAFRQVIHDVVWSVQPKVSADERKRLVGLIPSMTRVLRDGLSMIRMPEQEQQNFLRQLMASHAIAVRPVDQATYIKSKVSTGELRQRLDEMEITGTFPISGSGVKVTVGALQRAAEHHAAQLVLPEPVADAPPLNPEQESAFDQQIAGWERGSWFNLYDGKEVIKVKLRWISPLRTLFMFSSGEEKSARVLSPETIKVYLKQGWLKPLESVPLTKRIVNRLVGELERSPKNVEALAGRIGATLPNAP